MKRLPPDPLDGGRGGGSGSWKWAVGLPSPLSVPRSACGWRDAPPARRHVPADVGGLPAGEVRGGEG